MEEVVRRRLGYWLDEQSQSKFRRANLIIIDGGLPQLHAAEKAAETLGLRNQIEFVALAKREELLYRPGTSVPVALERGSESLYLVQRIRDEAHRFAVSFHRTKRAKSMIATVLDGVEGLGPKRRDRLMLVMGSLDNVRAATLDELQALPWLPAEVGQNLYDHVRAPSAPALRRERDSD
jgi:excinuclease ABC subunit C